MSTLKAFFVGVARVAAIIVLVILTLGAAGWGIYEFSQARTRNQEAPLAELKKTDLDVPSTPSSQEMRSPTNPVRFKG